MLYHLRQAHFPFQPAGSNLRETASGILWHPQFYPCTGRTLGEGNGSPLQDPRLRIPWTEEPDGLQCMGSQNWMLLSD